MVMFDDSITATRAKAQLLALLDEVARSGRTITVTKHGKPLVDLVPHLHDGPRDMAGSVEFLVDDDELIRPLDVEWNALKE